jgi:hypothetical protein
MTDETSSRPSVGAGDSSEAGKILVGGNTSDQPTNGTTRGDEPAGIVDQARDPAADTTERTGGVAPRQTSPDRLVIYRRRRNIIIGILLTLFGGAIYLVVRQTSYSSPSASEWLAGDTVAVGLVAAVIAVAAAAFAYPTFLEWRDQISGPDLKMSVQYRQPDGRTFIDLPKEATLTQNKNIPQFPILRIVVDNSRGRVALRDGRLGIYVQAPGNGDRAPDVYPKPLQGPVPRFESISDVRFSEDLVPATLLTTDSPCPPRSTSYFVGGFEFEDANLNLIIVLTGSNLRAPKTEHYKVKILST